MNYTVEQITHPKRKIPIWVINNLSDIPKKYFVKVLREINAIGGHYNSSKEIKKFAFWEEPDKTSLDEIFKNYSSNKTLKDKPLETPPLKDTPLKDGTLKEPSLKEDTLENLNNVNKETEEIKKVEKTERDIPILKKTNNLYQLTRYEYLSEALKDLSLSADVRIIYDNEKIVRATVRDILDKDIDINKINKIRKFINSENIILFSTAQHVSAIVRAIDAGLYVEYEILREYPKVLDRYKDKKAFTNNIPAELQFSFLIKDAQVFKTYDDFLNSTNTWAVTMGLKSAVGDSKNAFQMWFYYKLKYSEEVEDKYLKDEIYPVLEKYKKTKLDFWRECQRIKSKSKINARSKLDNLFNH